MSSLPETVTTLECPNGSKVFVVGTAHFSKESIDDVRRTIQLVRPQVILLELCPERQMMLKMSEEEILDQAKTLSWEKVREFMRREGTIAGITHATFIKISANLMDKLGVVPGGEFRAGFEEGKKISSAVMLGDRKIRITFKRALNSLPLWQQLRFFHLLTSSVLFDPDITLEEVEKMKNSDMVQLLTAELASELPALSHVFVNERDTVLTNSLMVAANCVNEPYGRPVNVVGVVGMGHVAGIKELWLSEECRDVSHLMTIPPSHWSTRLFWGTLMWSVQSIFTVGLYWLGRTICKFISRKLSTNVASTTTAALPVLSTCIYCHRPL